MKIILLAAFLTISGISGTFAQGINNPTELQAEPEDSSYIKIKWHDNSNNEAGFFVERSLINDTSSWEVIGTVQQNVILYFDYWVTRGRTYYYRVQAYNGQSRSGYSNIDSTVLLGDPSVIPYAPSDLRVTKTSTTSITIHWNDNSSNENGFIIARKREDELIFQYVDSVGTDVLTYQEVGLTPDNFYQYKVCAFNLNGISDYTNEVSARTENNSFIINNINEVPGKFFLGNNYPNPFNPTTNIRFGVTVNSFVKMIIYNSLGKEVETLLSQNIPVGTYQVKWNGALNTSGVYFYRFEAESLSGAREKFTEIKKMILIK